MKKIYTTLLILACTLLVNAAEITGGTWLFLAPNANWKTYNARFAAYFYNSSTNAWASMAATDEQKNMYIVQAPSGTWTGVIFCRMNPDEAANNWDNKWNQTSDLFYDEINNLYTVAEEVWDKGDGTWSTYQYKTNTVALNPTTIWNQDNPTFVVHVWNENGNFDIPMLAVEDEDDHYFCEVPDVFKWMLYYRKSSDGSELWNQTYDLDIPQNTINNCYKITSMGAGDEKSSGNWKTISTYELKLYKSYFGEYGVVYDNTKYYSPSTSEVVYDFPKGATLKVFSSPYNEAYRGDVMINQDGVRTTVSPNGTFTLTCNTLMDDNYVTTAEHVVYLGVPDNNGDWNQTSGTNYVSTFNNRTTYFPEESARVQMTFVETINGHNYFRCIVPAGFNSLRFEKDGTLKSQAVSLRTKDLSYSIPVNEMNCYTLGGKENGDNSKFYGGWDAAPAFNGDYRLLHMRDTATYTSRAVRKYTAPRNLLQLDTISMHIYTRDLNTKNHTLQWQQYNSSTKVWENIGAAKNVGDITTIMNDPKDDGCGVWNFVVTQKSNGATTIDLDNPHRYTGKYFIRTNNAEGGWLNYAISTNEMTYSSYAKAHSGYTHYYCRWVDIKDGSTGAAGKNHNVKFNIANEHGYGISKILAKDDHTASGGILPESANVRWAWDEVTNTVSRAYILGSGENIDHLLVDYKPNATSNANRYNLDDKENWIYERDLQDIQKGSILNSLSSTYPSKNTTVTVVESGETKTETITSRTQTFISNKPMITSDYGTSHKVRVMYDFKTNQTSVMLIPDKTATIGIDVLIERENQGEATQVTSPINAANEDGYTVYAAMTFSRDHIMSETATEWERLYYWVSFPFNVRISDVFGFGEYGKQWVIQYYNGALRAKNGYQSEDETFWRYINPKDTIYNPNKALEDANGNPCNGVMVANRGYILALAKSIAKQGIFQNNNDYVRLYFPSMEKIQSIDGDMQNVTAILKPYTCTISGREEYDSHWHMIGAPSYANKTVDVTQDNLFFFYRYDAQSNTYEVQETSSVNFKSMHSYMVQYAGNINWSANTTFVPQQIAASRNTDYEPQLCHLGLLLMQDGKTLDQTFIRMQEDNATADYDMNLDLTKIINSGANIYSLAGDKQIELAGNVLSTDDTTIPLGVLIRQTGDYTFSMPAGTDGAVVELIDYETNTRTNLLLSDYTVNIPTGTHTNRFALRVEQSKTATGIESPADNAAGVNKYIINGQLIIVRDGATYNTIGQQL